MSECRVEQRVTTRNDAKCARRSARTNLRVYAKVSWTYRQCSAAKRSHHNTAVAIEYNSPLRPARAASASELVSALEVDPRASNEVLSAALLQVRAKAQARLDIQGSAYLTPEIKELEKTWHTIRGNFIVPEEGILFAPSFEVRRSTDLNALRELSQVLAPLTEVTPESAKQIFVLDDLIQDRRLKGPSPTKQKLWESCINQAKRALEGKRGFISHTESEVITTLARRPVAPHLEPGARLGRTNLVWKKLDGPWEPCFAESRYKPISILSASRKYLEECMKRLPEDPKAAEQQRSILSRALRAINNSYGNESRLRAFREELRSALLREFPPRG
ncbi:MAG: hypothetical protein EBZ48_07180 [Proteobacteria bacterium]|nr:hypothetical protein [Pseudomonadota bacterium]